MAYTGRKVSGDEAKTIGLVNQTYSSKEELEENVWKLAQTIASKSPLAVRSTKNVLLYTRDHSVEESLDHVAMLNSTMLLSNDVTEVFKSQMEKRAPEFED